MPKINTTTAEGDALSYYRTADVSQCLTALMQTGKLLREAVNELAPRVTGPARDELPDLHAGIDTMILACESALYRQRASAGGD